MPSWRKSLLRLAVLSLAVTAPHIALGQTTGFGDCGPYVNDSTVAQQPGIGRGADGDKCIPGPAMVRVEVTLLKFVTDEDIRALMDESGALMGGRKSAEPLSWNFHFLASDLESGLAALHASAFVLSITYREPSPS